MQQHKTQYGEPKRSVDKEKFWITLIDSTKFNFFWGKRLKTHFHRSHEQSLPHFCHYEVSNEENRTKSEHSKRGLPPPQRGEGRRTSRRKQLYQPFSRSKNITVHAFISIRKSSQTFWQWKLWDKCENLEAIANLQNSEESDASMCKTYRFEKKESRKHIVAQ